MTSLRIGVIGVGHMGRRHAEKVGRLVRDGEPVVLAGLFDLDARRAAQVGRATGTPVQPTLEGLLRRCDAVVVAVPTTAHYAIVARALDAGCDVLVEKPIAETEAQARALIDHAVAGRRVLQVGHLDWFNPATRAMRRQVRAPRFVAVQRVGPFAERGTDVDIVRDLMIHDIDILQRLLREEPTRIDALGIRVVTQQVDVTNARMEFPSGCVADLTASRVAVAARREMSFFQADGCFRVDFLAGSASLVTAREPANEPAHRPSRTRPGVVAPRFDEQHAVFEAEDALLAQLRAFVAEVGKRSAPVASARTAVAALRTAERVLASMPRE